MTGSRTFARKVFSREFAGCLAVFASSLCFYMSTVVIRWSAFNVTINTASFVLTRFLIGFFIICGVMAIKKQSPVPEKYSLLFGRAAANFTAVYCFFKAVDLTTVAQANILNMTYPVFIVLLTWIFLKDQRDIGAVGIVIIAFSGVWLILAPNEMEFDLNNLWGLFSGITGAIAIFLLNISRKYHDSETVLFYLFGAGSVFTYACFYDKITVPNLHELVYLLGCSMFGIAGQYLMTFGFKYVTAVEGGIISSSRILMAAILGPIIAADPALGVSGWTGAALIFSANVVLTVRKSRPAKT
ncbi:DMT family transporter [Desulfobacterales bacterium HSG16]|nr:DMT family transporter [Desulfobacterales bacterium HSG16]